MRLHVTCHGKKTTISIDDQLMDYLGAWLAEVDQKFHGKAKWQHEQALAYIRRYVARQGDDLPTKNLSQHIQGLIVRLIAAPGLDSIIEARGPRYKKSRPDPLATIPDYANRLASMKAYCAANPLPPKETR